MTFLTEVEELRRSTNNKMSVYFQMAIKFKYAVVGSCNYLMADKGYQQFLISPQSLATVAEGG